METNNTATNTTATNNTITYTPATNTFVILSTIIDEITIEDKNSILENAGLLVDTLINKNPMLYIQPHFHTTVVKAVFSLLTEPLKGILALEPFFPDIMKMVEKSMQIFYTRIAPARSNGPTFIRLAPQVEKMTEKINYLKNIPQPDQRTTEWYEFRYRYLTASSIWKAFISESTKNQLITDKCKPLNIAKYNSVSLESPMHWGHKYEPLSIKLYEKMYETKVSDFGCLPHKHLQFLAASPDGINTEATSLRYGRMLEVKNIVNREITGIPKMEYWIQMQVQMEVCDLNECDFLETRFTEYPSEEEYEADCIQAPTIPKGLIMLFMRDGQPVYEYAPLDQPDLNLADWQDEIMEKNKDITWSKNIYWKLDQVSCVLVLRNKFWFAAAIPYLEEIWGIIQKEKVTGYEHRAPKKNSTRTKKAYENLTEISKTAMCFINIETALMETDIGTGTGMELEPVPTVLEPVPICT